jgi:class 3 adenylate cyclase
MHAHTEKMSNSSKNHPNGSKAQAGKPVSALLMKLEGSKTNTGQSSKTSHSSKSSKSSKSSRGGQSLSSIAGTSLAPKDAIAGARPTIQNIYGYNTQRDDDDDDDDEEEEGEAGEGKSSFVAALRRGSESSKSESEQKLAQQLAQVKDYSDKDDKIQTLKERFSGSKRNLKARMQRRSSNCSEQSYGSASFSQDTLVSEVSLDVMEASRHSEMSLHLSSHTLTSNAETLNSMNMSGTQRSSTSFNMSSNTLPAANVVKSSDQRKNSAEKDQIIESLVWFSFHTPRTVLEDLISHEMELWRSQRRNSVRNLLNGPESVRDDGSCSSMSDEGAAAGKTFSEAMVQMKVRKSAGDTIKLPKCVERESALLFVDMSGFTKLSTILDVESLSKVINSYFDMIVGEVIQYGGDILKFAGDAFFAEWKVVDDDNDEEGNRDNPLAHLNASLASINEFNWDDDDDIPKISSCVLSAAKCGASIVKKFSDYQVTGVVENTMLNVHCGVGVGHLVGLHVGDFKEDQEEEGVELRREFLILGEPIDQVSFDSACFCCPYAMFRCQLLLLTPVIHLSSYRFQKPQISLRTGKCWPRQKQCFRLHLFATCLTLLAIRLSLYASLRGNRTF